MLSSAGISMGKMITETFTGNTTWTAPAGVSAVNMLGNGAQGTAASNTYVQRYAYSSTIVAIRRSDGGYETHAGAAGNAYGPTPSGYCTATNYTPSDPYYSSNYTCYSYNDISYTVNNPATTGDPATGLGQTFPGSTGAVAPSFTSKPNTPVTPASVYTLVIPAGGSISITYYKP